jgi:alpha-N-acetylglucosamine transferase
MKRLIYQVYLGPKNKLYDFCTASVSSYCQKYEIDHYVQKQPILKILPDPLRTNRSKNAVEKLGCLPIYEKENAFDRLSDYDEICIVDADIYIRQNAPNVFDYFSSTGKTFGAVVERDMPITQQYARKIRNYSIGQYMPLRQKADFEWNELGAEFMNMGLMIFNKNLIPFINGTAEEFIRQPRFADFVDGLGYWKWSTDQTLLNYWIRRDKIPYARMDWRWNALYRGVRDDQLQSAYFIHFFLKDHLPNKGEGVEDLVKEMKLL